MKRYTYSRGIAMEKRIISRDAAHMAGERTYFTGRACKHGHIVERYVASGNCVSCSNINRKSYKSANRQQMQGVEWKKIEIQIHEGDMRELADFIQKLVMKRLGHAV